MAGFNKIILVGNLTRDPELRYTPSGAQVAKFGLAVNQKFGNGKERVDFFECTAWQKLAEVVSKYVTKGKQVLVEGEMHINRTENKKVFPEVNIRSLQLLGNKSDGQSQTQPQQRQTPNVQDIEVDDLGVDEFDAEDMPF